MSLIIEALKRARDDAVRRQAASKGLPLAPVPRLRGRSRWLTIAIVPLAAALVVCLLLLIDLYSRVPRSTPTGETSQEERADEDSSSELSLMNSPVAVDSTPSPTEGARVGQLPQNSAPAGTEDGSVAVVAPARLSAGTSDSPAEAMPDTEPPVIPRPAPQPVTSSAHGNAREFIGQAQLKDGQLVDLEGIAWSESEPFALLNGQVVGVGEIVRAYKVTEIHQNSVHLEQGEDRIVLRLK